MHLDFIKFTHFKSSQFLEIIIIIVVGRILFLTFTKVFEKKKRNLNADAYINNSPISSLANSIQNIQIAEEKGVKVQLFEEFQIWIDGEAIHYSDWGSKKARELFIFLLLKNHHGVTKDDIELTFWPDAHIGSAANSRAVALSRIRKTLGIYKNFIKKQDDRIRLDGEDLLISDFQITMMKMSDIPLEITELSIIPLKRYGKDGLLPGFHQKWIQDIKTDVDRRIINYAKKTGTQAIHEKKWAILDWIGERLLMWNALDDDGMKFRIIANNNMEKPGVANDVYNRFFNNYEKEIGDIYQVPFESIQ